MSFDSSRSANSDSKSKRSLNSAYSNPSSNSNNNKKKKTNQKTLGMAWGPNSRSSSRSSFRNSPFSDFGSYMVVKNRKLQDQFDAEASSSSNSASNSGKPIFHGISIFVDGFTVPSSQELRGYMLKFGGRFENYFSRHRVTHIICSNLPDSKIKNLRSFSGGLPVVKPTWVLDSVASNKLLSWVPYQLDQLASETHKQPKLSTFFALKRDPVSDVAAMCFIDQLKVETEDTLLKGGTIKDSDLSEVGESIEHGRECSRESEIVAHGNATEAIIKETTCNNGTYIECEIAEPRKDTTVDKNSDGIQAESSPCQPSASVSSYCRDNQKVKELSSPTIVVPSNQNHSTLVDPDFVENYFKNSRLHFIGTWRSRYRKRFPSLSDGFKHASTDLSAFARRTSIIHVDMDCFFVSVVIRNHPELLDKPVAVCHSDNPRGTAEISSANYPARDYGVRAGIFVRDAKALCPHLVIFPYNFEAYEEVADQFYNILHKHCNKVQAVSCDEAFLDVTDSEMEDAQFLASVIRKEIFETTGCTASAGIAGNLLMARLATRTAKPDGQCYIPPEKVDDYLCELPIKALPGIGHVLEEKLKKRQVQTCGQLRMISKESLQKDFGVKTGDMLWNYSRGVDNRLVGAIQESKSIGADVNWGVRFKDLKDVQHFLLNLCKEVSLRLQGCGVLGRTFTLKMKKRKNDSEPIKYLGCGNCENLSRSMTIPLATDDVDVLRKISTQLFGSLCIEVKDIRGMGLQVSKLESADTANQGNERNSIRSWLASASASAGTEELPRTTSSTRENTCRDFDKQTIDGNPGQFYSDPTGSSFRMGTNMSNGDVRLNQDSVLPSLCDLDLGVVESLPPELFSEINDMYGGKLVNLISKNKGKSATVGSSLGTTSYERLEGVINEGKGPFPTHLASLSSIPVQNKDTVEKIQSVPVSGAGSSNEDISTSLQDKFDLMPSSLSQVDVSVLQQLPEELRVDIFELLPPHRRPECSSDGALSSMLNPQESSYVKLAEKPMGSMSSLLSNDLWVGNPPKWVGYFRDSNFWIFNILAEMYYRAGSTGFLSSILQHTISESRVSLVASIDGWDDAVSCLCELLKQYIELKIETDIEEIYVCFRHLRRLTSKSKFFLQVYDVIFPHLQVGALYVTTV
ncbi:DNA repair protein REV1 isoform X2 [Cornus florida]|uniref:DNA repair protein REV1 isoform X2 n=1 Tax=Cornus florida TaxID=4283 RepID=UPI00289CA24C|nr:DNA repair protein REV1 isoform X2 [Cornus florida]